VVLPVMGGCSSGVGAAGVSGGGAGLTGASGAVDEVTSVATVAGGTVGGACVARALDVAGRAAVGGVVIWLETGSGARTRAIAVTTSPATTIARVDSPRVFIGGERGPGAWKTSGPSRNQAICCSSSRTPLNKSGGGRRV
jgi:hypothetical protein